MSCAIKHFNEILFHESVHYGKQCLLRTNFVKRGIVHNCSKSKIPHSSQDEIKYTHECFCTYSINCHTIIFFLWLSAELIQGLCWIEGLAWLNVFIFLKMNKSKIGKYPSLSWWKNAFAFCTGLLFLGKNALSPLWSDSENCINARGTVLYLQWRHCF